MALMNGVHHFLKCILDGDWYTIFQKSEFICFSCIRDVPLLPVLVDLSGDNVLTSYVCQFHAGIRHLDNRGDLRLYVP